jgi:hypothetical protein
VLRVATLMVMLVIASACDAPWDGPTLPTGARTVAYRVVNEEGPSVYQDRIRAATSVGVLLEELLNDTRPVNFCQLYASSFGDPCWARVADEPGKLYVAVTSAVVCYRAVKETAALSGHTLYFIYWIGKPQNACNLALAVPHFRLLSFERKDLPASGTLTVDLQTQEDSQTSNETTEVDLT